MTAPALRLVDTDTGELHDGCPHCPDKDETIAALQAEVTRLLRRNNALQKKINEDMGLDPKAADVQSVYDEYIRVLKPRTRKKKIPADRLKMGLERLKSEEFTVEDMIQAVHGGKEKRWITNDRTGEVYDEWENIFRTTGHTKRYISYAERAAAEREREMPFGMHVAGVLRAASLYDVQRSTELEVRGSCPVCGGGFLLDVRSGLMWCQRSCDTADIGAAVDRLAATYGLVAA